MPLEQDKYQMEAQDFQSVWQALRWKKRASCKACPALGLMRFVYFWLEKSTSTKGKFALKTNPEVSSADLTCCSAYKNQVRVLTFVQLLLC